MMKVRDILAKVEAWRKLVNLILLLDSNASELRDAALKAITHQMMSYIHLIAAYELEENEH